MDKERREYFLSILEKSTVKYNPDEMKEIESLIQKISDKLEKDQLSLYTFVVLLGFDLETAKKMGYYLIDTGVLDNFPRIPSKNIKMTINRQIFPNVEKMGKSSYRELQPYEGDEPFIFIAYAHVDKNQVYQIIKNLQDDGFKIWLDKRLNAGEEWREIVQMKIQKCQVFIAFLTRNALKSRHLIAEILIAIENKKKYFCVFLEEIPKEDIPPELQYERILDIEHIMKFEMDDATFYEKLKIGIRRLQIQIK